MTGPAALALFGSPGARRAHGKLTSVALDPDSALAALSGLSGADLWLVLSALTSAQAARASHLLACVGVQFCPSIATDQAPTESAAKPRSRGLVSLLDK